jgi:hypothetical protein
MSTIDEAITAKTPLGSDLAAGVESLSLDQEITFTLYRRLILPLDGYAFWVKADMISASAMFNQTTFNRTGFNVMPTVALEAPTFTAKGSLHFATDTRQEESETYSASRVTFTAEEEVQNLGSIAPNTLWIGSFGEIRFAFSSRGSFYKQADLFHYLGFAIYADMETQIIDSPIGFRRRQVVSNSLPGWLAINNYQPPYGFGNPGIVLYPSFLVPDNIHPPFAAVHIDPNSTTAMSAVPLIGPDSSHSQLCADRVRLTIWGLNNDSGTDLMDCIFQYARDADVFGITNMPVLRDEKRTQSELLTLAMKKSADFEVSYQQGRQRDIAQQYITSVIPSFIPGET